MPRTRYRFSIRSHYAVSLHNGSVVILIKLLHNVLLAAGYLAIAVLAVLIEQFGKPELGRGIFATASGMMLTLLIASAVVKRRQKKIMRSVHEAEAAGAAGITKSFSAYATETYEHDAHAVWALIRPAESAILLSDAQRAFTVPGTPRGVGEQQCLVNHDGSASIVEVIGEESPWWATTRPVAKSSTTSRSTYRLEPTVSGCRLTVGTVIEIPANAELAVRPEEWWEQQMRPYLNRIREVLDAGQARDESRA